MVATPMNVVCRTREYKNGSHPSPHQGEGKPSRPSTAWAIYVTDLLTMNESAPEETRRHDPKAILKSIPFPALQDPGKTANEFGVLVRIIGQLLLGLCYGAGGEILSITCNLNRRAVYRELIVPNVAILRHHGDTPCQTRPRCRVHVLARS